MSPTTTPLPSRVSSGVRRSTPTFPNGAARLVFLVWLGLAAGALVPRAAEPTEKSAPAVTEPILDVTASVTAAGTLSKRHFREGDFVREGELILELDKRFEELAVMRRQAVMENLKTDLEATRHLFATAKSVSKEELDKKELEYKVAVVDHETAVEQLRRRHLYAPMDGYIAEFLVEVGEDCKAQEPVVRLVDTRRCYLVANVEAKYGRALRPGDEVRIAVESGATETMLSAKVSFVSPVVDPASGLLKVKAVFENTDGKLRPGVAGRLVLPALP